MFSNAYELASKFTYPLILSTRQYSGQVKCSIGAFIILNEEGWVITAAHMVQALPLHQSNLAEISSYSDQVNKIKADRKLDAKKRKRKLSRLKPNPDWLTNVSFWWGTDGARIQQFNVLPGGDIAVGKLDPFDPKSISHYPVIKDPTNLRIGTSLCKLGFPFHNADATFDDKTGNFTLAKGTLPIPRFPIEGIYTRNMVSGHSPDGKYEFKFIETSTPGLRGQSGGPVFDINGTVWGLQSRTHHFPLGFSPKIKRKGRDVEENQFLNVGLAVHPQLITQFLDDNGIMYDRSNY